MQKSTFESNRRKKALLLTLFLLNLFAGNAQNSRLVGFVKLQSSGNQALEDVEIFALGANKTYTDNHGVFVLEFPKMRPGDIVRNIECSKQGYVVINEEVLKAIAIPNKEADLVPNIVMCKKEEYRLQKSYYYNLIIDNTYKIQEEIRKLDKNLQKVTITDKERIELNEKIKKLEGEKLQLEKRSEELSELLVKTDLDQASQIAKKSHELVRQGKLKEAIELLDDEAIHKEIAKNKAELESAKQNLLKKDSAFHQSVDNLILKARFCILDRDYSAAYRNYLKAINADPDNVAYYLEIANFCLGVNDLKKAIQYYNGALDRASNDYQKSLIWDKLGYVFTLNAQLSEGEKAINRAIKIQKQLRETGRSQTDLDLAVSYRHLAEVYNDMHKNSMSNEYYQKCLSILKSLPPNTNGLNEELAVTFNSYGTLLDGQRNYHEAKEYYIQSSQLYDKLILNDSSKYLPLWSKVLNNLGNNASFTDDLAEAENYYLKCLGIRRILVENDPQKYKPILANVLLNLGTCYRDMMAYSKASRYLEESIGIYTALSSDNPDPYRANLALLYHSSALVQYATRAVDDAVISLEKSILLYEILSEDNPELYNSEWRSVYFDIAQIYFETDSILLASRYCKLAVKIPTFQPDPETICNEENRLGVVYLFLDSLPQAEQCFTKLLAMQTSVSTEKLQLKLDSFTAFTGLACIAAKKGKNAEACNFLSKALDSNSTSNQKFSFTDLMLVNRLLANINQMKSPSFKLKQLTKGLLEKIKVYYSKHLCRNRTEALCNCIDPRASNLCEDFVRSGSQLFPDYFKVESKGLNETSTAAPENTDGGYAGGARRKRKDYLREKSSDNFYRVVSDLSYLNLPKADYTPAYFDNGLMLISRRHDEKTNPKDGGEGPFLAIFNAAGGLIPAVPFSFSSNDKSMPIEGPVAFSRDFKTAYITRRNNGNANASNKEWHHGNSKIYQTKLDFPGWTPSVALPFNIENYSCKHPSLSPDGKWLFFASDMPGGSGGFDLYAVECLPNDQWGEPINLGDAINSEKQELYPFMSHSGRLFFSSDGHYSLGGLDIFSVDDPLDKVYKKELLNLGAALNSASNDFAFIMDKGGRSGFFVSERKGKGAGKSDIFQFLASGGNAPLNSLKINVLEDKTGLPVQGAEIRIFQTSDDGLIIGNDDFYEFDYIALPNKPDVFTLQLARKNVQDIGRADLYSNAVGSAVTDINRYQNYLVVVNAKGFASRELLLTADTEEALNLSFRMKEAEPCMRCGGIVLVDNLNTRIANAIVRFEHLTSGAIETARTTRNGEFDICLPRNGQWTVSVEKSGFKTEKARLIAGEGTVAFEEIRLKPLEEGVSMAEAISLATDLKKGSIFINDKIFYEYNRATLSQGAVCQLKAIFDWLKAYPNMVIDLVAHSDARGDSDKNQLLTQKRAFNVKHFLVSQGISEHRINAYGKGETQLLNRCVEGVECAENEHLENNRIEIKIRNSGIE